MASSAFEAFLSQLRDSLDKTAVTPYSSSSAYTNFVHTTSNSALEEAKREMRSHNWSSKTANLGKNTDYSDYSL